MLYESITLGTFIYHTPNNNKNKKSIICGPNNCETILVTQDAGINFGSQLFIHNLIDNLLQVC